jgi:hypothetical protein
MTIYESLHWVLIEGRSRLKDLHKMVAKMGISGLTMYSLGNPYMLITAAVYTYL